MEVNRFEEIRDKAQRMAVAVKEVLGTIISPKMPLESISTSLIADALEPELRRLEHGLGAHGKPKENETGLCSACGKFPTTFSPSVQPADPAQGQPANRETAAQSEHRRQQKILRRLP